MVSGHRDRSCDPQIVIFDKQPEEDCITDFDKWISDWTDKRTNSESDDKLILTPGKQPNTQALAGSFFVSLAFISYRYSKRIMQFA